ncbi:hypothetical protein PT974_07636 [Cladobotryum mycophilum]|uniref:PA14 domain-containing protein n=1 Tax=Cladobotryum mycophilum TaxID=491253 RepID=A0ABR0SPZ9_9HYPO
MKFTKNSLAVLAFAVPSVIDASPVSGPGQPNDILGSVECVLVNVVINVLKGYPSATPFCSSFLHVPTVTETCTETVTQPTTVSSVITTTITPVVTSYTTTTMTSSTCTAGNHKRDSPYRPPPPPPQPSVPIVPDCLSGFQSSQISRACSCLCLPTPTATATSTLTVVPTSSITVSVTATADPSTTTFTVTSTSTVNGCPAPTPCGNQGLQWEYLNNTSGPNRDNTYSNFKPDQYKGQAPVYEGVTDSIGGLNARGGVYLPIYGSTRTLYTDNMLLNHRGYIYAQQTGTYTFTISGVDDAVYIWIGPLAYAGWLGSNANSRAFYNLSSGRPGVGTFTISLQEGEYYPVRIIFGQGNGGAVFQLSVTSPDGTIFLGNKTAGSPYLVQYSCDGVTAPAYPGWQEEK